MCKLFDTHSHYFSERFDNDRDEVIDRLFKENNISGIMTCGDSIKTSIDSIRLAHKYPDMYASAGIHPEECENAGDLLDSLEQLMSILCDDKIKALGEIGLDYYWNVPHDLQKLFFDAQLSVAEEYNLPVIIHDRDAHKDTLDLIKSHKDVYGIMHCYSGSLDFAKEYLNMNFYISIGGPITYKNNVKTVEVAEYVPLDRILVETDAPYLPPVPFRGQRNDSSMMKYVAEKICEIKKISYDQFCEIETNNARTIFGII